MVYDNPAPEINLGSHGAITHREMLALAPSAMHSFWTGRYTAENERQTLAHFAVDDQVLLQSAYDLLLRLFVELKPVYAENLTSRQVIRSFIVSGESARLVALLREFGSATLAHPQFPGIERAIHDLRGGAFQALACRFELFGEEASHSAVLAIYFLTRDHLKIMRNGVSDLDPRQFEADRHDRYHDAGLLTEKWSQTEFHGGGHAVVVDFECLYTGTLCESCLEFSTLDRIIYNLMNNAARYADDNVVHFAMIPVPEPSAQNVRFVFSNAVSKRQRQILEEKYGADPGFIFEGGFTTQGHGLGLRICADFCIQAYGFSSFEQGKAGGYFGAKWVGEQFVSWFHWPISHS